MRRVIRVIGLPVIFAVSAGIGFWRGHVTSPAPVAGVAATTGDERLPMGTRQARFWPFGDQEDGRPVSVERPSRVGPRHSGQSDAPVALRPPTTATVVRAARRKNMRVIAGNPIVR